MRFRLSFVAAVGGRAVREVMQHDLGLFDAPTRSLQMKPKSERSDNGGFPAYSFLEQAAAEARKASRRYWAKGGAADRRYPRQPIPWWPEAPAAGGNEAIMSPQAGPQLEEAEG